MMAFSDFLRGYGWLLLLALAGGIGALLPACATRRFASASTPAGSACR